MSLVPSDGGAGVDPALPRVPRVWTSANLLTLLRLVAAPLAAYAVWRRDDGAALLLFVFAIATDLLDGPLARRRGEASALGGLLDHATDATFVSLGLLACAYRDLVPLGLPLLVGVAFLQYTLDSRALRGRALRASRLGRWNGIAYFVLLGVPVVRDGIGLGWPPDSWVWILGWLLVGSTLVSIGARGRLWLEARRS
jgi:CDP-diacylglycerol--glycerol-3-phosphate 3-phosphatidyltransferase